MLCKVTGMNQRPLAGTPTSQRTQVVRHVAELLDHLGVAEIAGGWITRSAKRDRANVPLFARQRLSAHHGCIGIEAFRRLPSRHAVVTGDER